MTPSVDNHTSNLHKMLKQEQHGHLVDDFLWSASSYHQVHIFKNGWSPWHLNSEPQQRRCPSFFCCDQQSRSVLTVGSVLSNEVSVETLVYDDFSVVHPHQLHTEISDLSQTYSAEPHQIHIYLLFLFLKSLSFPTSLYSKSEEPLIQHCFMAFRVKMLQLLWIKWEIRIQSFWLCYEPLKITNCLFY